MPEKYIKRPKQKKSTPQKDWLYKQPETGVEFKANHWRVMESLVQRHRQSNLAVLMDLDGGWRERLWHDICEQNPQVPYDLINGPSFSMSFDNAKRAFQFIWKFLESGGKLVEQERAEARAKICTSGANGQKCPHNQALGGCLGCKGIAALIDSVRGNKRTSQEDRLDSCEVCGGCMLKSKVWVPLEAMDNEGKVFPSFCWVNREKGEGLG